MALKRPVWRWWWLLLILPVAAGWWRLRFAVEVLDLLPSDVRAVAGLKLYQQHFANARELIITVRAAEAEVAETLARTIAERLRRESNAVAEVTWQPPWQEHPEQTAELIADLWLNQPPAVLAPLAQRLATTNLPAVLAATREQLTMTLSPTDIAQLSYDPFGLTRLPEDVAGGAPRLGEGEAMFASADGTFRLLFVKAAGELNGYQECTKWFGWVQQAVNTALGQQAARGVSIGYTGRPAFVAEISSSMRRDMVLSIGGTAVIIALLFWLAHRRWTPMLWLLTLLALILAGTLALGGLVIGTINVVSLGFAAILLGLAVDYAVVHYQEALAHPNLTVPEIRRAIAPSIFWAAVTTITSFLVLNFGGLPGLAQLGSLVAIGVALSAAVMIFAFLPPLFPDRRLPRRGGAPAPPEPNPDEPTRPHLAKVVFLTTAALIVCCGGVLWNGVPRLDPSAQALQPRHSRAYATLEAVKAQPNQQREPLWVVVQGRNEGEVARRLEIVEPWLRVAVSNHTLAGFTLPTMLWPRPDFQAANQAALRTLLAQREALHAAALANGFAPDALGLTDGILDTWQRAVASRNVFWPTNRFCTWVLEKFVARDQANLYAAGFLFPATNAPMADASSLRKLDEQLPTEGVWVSSWELLGSLLLATVQGNLWKLLAPIAGLVLLSLWLAFRRTGEVLLSVGTLLLSGLCLMAVMRLTGWSWNLLNLMALPLILGTGVDYSIFMQLALRRHQGRLDVAHRSVGRALLLCGGTAVSGFGSLGLSSNAGMASLGQVCAVGIGCNMLISVYLLPAWWRRCCHPLSAGGLGLDHNVRAVAGAHPNAALTQPSASYRPGVWRLGKVAVRLMPDRVCLWLSKIAALIYWRLRPERLRVVADNLEPAVQGDRGTAERAARVLFQEFAIKLTDLWRFENGLPADHWLADWSGWEIFAAAQARGKGVLMVTPHLGNWEIGGAFLARRGLKLMVLTQTEPGRGFTEMRQSARARWGIETLVISADAFAFVEVIKRLQAGAIVALLIDRPRPQTAVTVELFGRPFEASIAAAELARAAGCALVPVYVVRHAAGYSANVLPEIVYDRAAIGHRAGRQKLTQEILRAFEPVIRQYLTQWYHFVPVWPRNSQPEA